MILAIEEATGYRISPANIIQRAIAYIHISLMVRVVRGEDNYNNGRGAYIGLIIVMLESRSRRMCVI